QPYVVISGSSSLYRRDRSPTDIRTAFVALCSQLQGAGVNPVLWEADQRDRILLRPAALQLQLPYVSAAIPLHLAQALLAGAVCLVSGRWHASILAARWGCPSVLGDANFFKTSALHEMLGLGTPMFDFR